MTHALLSEADRAAVEAAVQRAEAGTTGEIFCVVAAESSDYSGVPLAWAAAVALLAPALLLATGVHVTAPDLSLVGGWTADQVEDVGEATARAALTGALLLQAVLFLGTLAVVSLGPVRRALTPRGLKRSWVRRRAREQFLARNLHLTRERTGVLVYASAAERMAELVADEAIDACAPAGTWDAAMTALTSGLKRGRAAEGFVACVGQCGAILATHFPARAGDNPDELSNAVVVLPSVTGPA